MSDTPNMSETIIMHGVCNLLQPMVTSNLSTFALMWWKGSHIEGVELCNHVGSNECGHVSDYAKIVVELWLVYMALNDIIKLPEKIYYLQ